MTHFGNIGEGLEYVVPEGQVCEGMLADGVQEV